MPRSAATLPATAALAMLIAFGPATARLAGR